MSNGPRSIAVGRPARRGSASSCPIAVPSTFRREVLLVQAQAITTVIARWRATDGP
jgi:hypothetical protein